MKTIQNTKPKMLLLLGEEKNASYILLYVQ